VSEVVRVQYGALPWRVHEGELQFLLVTTLNSKRWIIPKGWASPGLAPSGCAASEALEEAGVEGRISSRALGSFQYFKRLKNGETTPLRVQVFALEVSQQRQGWAEMHLRETRWFAPEEALQRLNEPGLKRLVAKFAKDARPALRHSPRTKILTRAS
jgi:8-oxo-dGTP pyrophosphatase MutT (NUDIX family)